MKGTSLMDKFIKWSSGMINDDFFEIITDEGQSPGELIRAKVRALTTDTLIHSGAESAVSVSPVNPNLVVAGMNSGWSRNDVFQ